MFNEVEQFNGCTRFSKISASVTQLCCICFHTSWQCHYLSVVQIISFRPSPSQPSQIQCKDMQPVCHYWRAQKNFSPGPKPTLSGPGENISYFSTPHITSNIYLSIIRIHNVNSIYSVLCHCSLSFVFLVRFDCQVGRSVLKTLQYSMANIMLQRCQQNTH